MENIKQLRIYTGSGYEDFVVGEEVVGVHILSKKGIRIVRNINVISYEKRYVDIFFVDGEKFTYTGLNFRVVK
jgi:hypothetical protein